MSVRYIPENVKLRLWGKAAGRCQYEGCNKPLWLDSLTKVEFNTAYIAHIIADKPGGARYNVELSDKLKADISNLMLMCDEHHRLIDKKDVGGHPVKRLRGMKKRHEERIELLSSLMEDKRSHVLLYGANIGQHHSPISWDKAFLAMLPDWYPAERQGIDLSLKGSSFHDHDRSYWAIEREHLRRQFSQLVKPRLAAGQCPHLSVFALAPQPLLIELGRLLSDIPAAEVYQLHREPPNWIWIKQPREFQYFLHKPVEYYKKVVLKLSLSATIDNSRIRRVLGKNISIWSLTIKNPNNDFLKSREQLSLFRQVFRQLLDRIKARHGQGTVLHLFPAVPVSIAVEIGRVWMPKADMPICIYDQNRRTGGFVKAFQVRNGE